MLQWYCTQDYNTQINLRRKMKRVSNNSPTGEMTEKNLLFLAKTFFPDDYWIGQKRFYYDPSNKRRFYKVDCFSETRKTIWEYEGPDHYNNVWKLKRDKERKEYFENLGYTFLRWPYYLQLTMDVARHFFEQSFTIEKFEKAFKHIYKVESPDLILSPGFHTTKNTPANYVSKGTRRFFSELTKLPPSVERQVAETLRRYISAVEDPYLIIGEENDYKALIKKEFLAIDNCVYFSRKNPKRTL